MAKRSLKASEVGIKKAKQAFQRTGWTQEYLASAVGLETRQSIWKFFSGRPIERHLFIDVCFQLNLEWEDIVAPPEQEEEIEVNASEIHADLDQTLQTLRSQIKATIQTQCGLLQISLDTAHPLAVEQVYTSVRVLPTPSSQRWLEVVNLQAEDSGDRDVVAQKGTSIPIANVISTHTRLVILGKPGAGKTTLLQYLATQCLNGDLYADRLPSFISLRTFALEARTNGDLSLEAQIGEQWKATGLGQTQINALLQSGKGLLLLDWLDEVPRQDSNQLAYQIQKFAETYPQTTILITCRLAAQDYQFHGFTYIELADFDCTQIATVARKWFVAMSQGQQGNPVIQAALKLESDLSELAKAEAIGLAKAEQFLQHLDRPENEPIREMVTTPLLLHLACLVFYERVMFPTKRAKLYQAGLDILLVRWDNVRGIQRDLGVTTLSLPETLNLLSQIASTLFEQGKTYFEKSEVLPIITDFLQTLPHAATDPETLWLASEAVLRAITLQSGLLSERARDIYSFSHLTFQEYLTARKIAARCLKDHTVALHQLAQHTAERRWNEVILLTLSLLPKAAPLLDYMRQEVDAIARENSTLQQALQWVNQKAQTAPTTYKAAAVKAFYLPLCYNQNMSLALALDDAFAFDLDPSLAIDLAIARTHQRLQQMGEQPTYEQILDLWFVLDFGRQFPRETRLNQALIELKAQFPSLERNELEWQTWWKTHKTGWLKQFHERVLKPQKMDFCWHLSPLQQQILWEYYRTNQFLVACLNSECSVDEAVRSHIESTLLSEEVAAVPLPCIVRP